MSTIPAVLTPNPIVDFTPEKQYPSFSGLINQKYNPATISDAAAKTYTVNQVLGGFILRDTNGAARTDTLPSAADLIPQIEGADVGSAIRFIVRNTADAAETLTIAAGSGGTTSGTMTIAESNQKEFLLVVTAVGDQNGVGAAYTVYSLGTVVF